MPKNKQEEKGLSKLQKSKLFDILSALKDGKKPKKEAVREIAEIIIEAGLDLGDVIVYELFFDDFTKISVYLDLEGDGYLESQVLLAWYDAKHPSGD